MPAPTFIGRHVRRGRETNREAKVTERLNFHLLVIHLFLKGLQTQLRLGRSGFQTIRVHFGQTCQCNSVCHFKLTFRTTALQVLLRLVEEQLGKSVSFPLQLQQSWRHVSVTLGREAACCPNVTPGVSDIVPNHICHSQTLQPDNRIRTRTVPASRSQTGTRRAGHVLRPKLYTCVL